jgi:hypothetical protein
MRYAVLVLWLVFPVELLATKACPLPPCYTPAPAYAFDAAKCRHHSDWIAHGDVTVIAHNVQGMPLNRDFLTFIFDNSTWEKGSQWRKQPLKFTVGWCKNALFPKGLRGSARIYGVVVQRPGEADEYRFLYIEKL